jgi:hypothetical protein
VAERRAAVWRPILSWLLLIVFCLSAPLALVAGWARDTILPGESYTAVVGGLARDGELQESVARHSGALVGQAIRGENPTATAALLADAAANTIADAVRDVVATEPFAGYWQEAHRTLHEALITPSGVDWGRPAVLDLSPVLPLVQRELDERQLDLPEDVTLQAQDLRIRLLDAATADAVRRNVARLAVGSWALLAVAALALALSLAVAADRLAALGRAGFGLGIAMVALILLLVVGQQWVVSAAGTTGGGEVIGAILDASSQGLRLSAVALALLGLLVAGICFGLDALRGSTARRAATEK